jgi:hypothetical protein
VSAPSYAPPQTPRRGRRGGVVGPLILIFVGGVFLLENTGYLPPNAWLSLWRLWPLVLVLGGIELLFAHRIPWLILGGLAVVIMGVGVFVTLFGAAPASAPGLAPVATETPLGGANQATVAIRFGAGQLSVDSLADSASPDLAVTNYVGPPELAPIPRYVATPGGVGQLEYQLDSHSTPGFVPFIGGRSDATRLDVSLNPGVPITLLNVQTGAADAHLDLSALKVSSLEMAVGASATWIRLPAEVDGTTTAHISGGASSLTLEIPPGVAAQLRVRGGLSNLSIDQNRFPNVGGGVYRSPDYATAQRKIDLNLETGLTSIQVS